MTDKRNEYIQGYINSHYKRISLNLSKTKDKDILEAIEAAGKGNIQAGVKSLIRRSLNSKV